MQPGSTDTPETYFAKLLCQGPDSNDGLNSFSATHGGNIVESSGCATSDDVV